MSDPFVPEPDRLEQEAEVSGPSTRRSREGEPSGGSPALDYPDTVPAETSEADALEQAQEVPQPDEEEQR